MKTIFERVFTFVLIVLLFGACSTLASLDRAIASPDARHVLRMYEVEHKPTYHLWKGLEEYKTGTCLKMYWHFKKAEESKDVMFTGIIRIFLSFRHQTPKCRNEKFA